MDNIKYNDKLVAFIDILGFSQIISNSTDKDLRYIDILDKNITHALKMLKGQYNDSFSIKVFSDCICISCDNTLESFISLIKELAYLQFFFSSRDVFFMRGGLTNGLHFESDNIIFSKGLVKAYDLEKNATYPRIIIDYTIIESLKYEDKSFLMRAPDGNYFIDYLDYITTIRIHPGDVHTFMMQHKMAIIKQVKANLGNNSVLDKYRWLTEYHNLKINDLLVDYEDKNIELEAIKDDIFINAHELFPRFEK